MSKSNEPGALAILAVLSLAFLNGGSQMLSPAVASLSAQFPDLPYASITMIMTIVNIVTLPALLISGAVAGKKVRFRPLCLFGTAVFSVGGVIPFFFQDSYLVIMVSRVLVAIGAGCVISLPATLAFRLFSGDKAQLVQGWSNASSSIMGAVMMLIVGFLASVSVDLIWLSHLLSAVSFLLVASALPEPESVEVAVEKGSAGKEPLPSAVWGLFFACIVAMAGMYPVLINSSLIIADNAWGEAGLAGACNAISSGGSFLAGAAFGRIYAKSPRLTPLMSAIIASVGSLVLYLAPSYPVLVVGSFLVGWGFMQFFCYLMGAAGVVTPPSCMAMVMSGLLAANNLAVFIAPHVSSVIQALLPAGNYQTPFVAYAFVWALLGLVVFLWYPEGSVNPSWRRQSQTGSGEAESRSS